MTEQDTPEMNDPISLDLQQDEGSLDSSLPKLITRSELAKILKVSEHTLAVRRKELEHVLPMVKLNDRVIRYKLSDVQKLIERGGL
jgi:hypothetical protein